MIHKLEITGVRTETDPKIRKYVTKRVARLERYIPKKARGSVHVEVVLSEDEKQKNNKCTAEIIMRLPQETLTAKESTMNLFAAVDIVEAKLRNQLSKYKTRHGNKKLYRRLTDRFRRRNPNQI